MINVTKPFLPPKEEYENYLCGIWNRNWLTNNGPLVNELELKLKESLNIKHLLFLANGTLALQLAIKVLKLKGEIITTPFSYVATTSCIVWEDCKPVFVDIDSKTFNIDPAKIEASITEKTSAILATHVFGNPCEIDFITKIAQKYNLKVIYDAAHCFESKYKGESVLSYGDVSAISFHATKLFHTIEGGAITTSSPEILKSLALLRNFGHDGFENFNGIGINAKNSEFHAAMGLVNLNYIDKILEKRKNDTGIYKEWLCGKNIDFQHINKKGETNHSYLPVVFENQETCIKVLKALEREQISARRYFYPSLNKLDYVQNKSCPNSESISERILCLPLYYDLSKVEIDMICRIIIRTLNY